MDERDVLGRYLERGVFRRLEPFERELAGVDPLHGREPEALEFLFVVPVRGEHARADL